ncbi:transposase [Domibacillus sp. A3M-37]|uniref:transposase n=1 Tax=Domibacillus sp. A3M-37 TaxID=2962037 RepID=UPI0020B83238|nr:transposase [Domibacillus sp. A3M-37]MCP3764375.1 transposase [Domibacillus sp. A3M-37]
MKNHKRVNGKLLQTRKKWSHLKVSQKEWISGLLREQFVSFLKQIQNPPGKLSVEQILADVMVYIEEKEIWVSENEV